MGHRNMKRHICLYLQGICDLEGEMGNTETQSEEGGVGAKTQIQI